MPGLLVVLLVGCEGEAQPKPHPNPNANSELGYPTDWAKQDWVEEFSLMERGGKPFHSKDMGGKVWVVSVFFSSCPTECVKQNEQIKALHSEFEPQGVTFVSITCDAETDSPKRLREYAHRFTTDSKGWLFLTGTDTHLRQVANERFKLMSFRPPNANTADKFSHSSSLAAIDKWGNLRDSFNWKSESEIVKLMSLLKGLLAETEPPKEFKQINGVRLIEQDSGNK